ncbi:putative transcriptional regulator, partial [Dysosmobacter welbionis]
RCACRSCGTGPRAGTTHQRCWAARPSGRSGPGRRTVSDPPESGGGRSPGPKRRASPASQRSPCPG